MKLVIWENIASPHQSHFFKALAEDENFDIVVRYFERFHEERSRMGWRDNILLPDIEMYVEPDITVALQTISDWKERIHIIPGYSYAFTQNLVDYLIRHEVPWIHWSERGGVLFAEKLGFRMNLFDKLYPLYAKMTKVRYAKLINQHALGALGQGILAIQDFENWGVKHDKIGKLFYTIKEPIVKNRPSELGEKDTLKFIYVGSLTQRKGLDTLIRAFGKIDPANDTELFIVGNGPMEKILKSLSSHQKNSKQMHFLGPKPIEEIPNFIAHCDILVLPTLFDGWGAVVMEAFAVGRGVISTDQCGAAMEMVEEDREGFITKAGDSVSLYRVLKRYIEDPARVRHHGLAAKRKYEEFFTPEKNVSRLKYAIERFQKRKGQNF